MSQLPVAQAAKLVGRDRKTLYRLIKDGKLSATQDATGSRQIDTAELLRVFGSLKDTADSGETVSAPQTETSDIMAKVAALEAENAQLRERVADKDRHIEDMRHTVRLLENQSPKNSRWWPWPKQ
jgi:excisionase family DNA binding protein